MWGWSSGGKELNSAFDFAKISCRKRSHSKNVYQSDRHLGKLPKKIN